MVCTKYHQYCLICLVVFFYDNTLHCVTIGYISISCFFVLLSTKNKVSNQERSFNQEQKYSSISQAMCLYFIIIRLLSVSTVDFICLKVQEFSSRGDGICDLRFGSSTSAIITIFVIVLLYIYSSLLINSKQLCAQHPNKIQIGCSCNCLPSAKRRTFFQCNLVLQTPFTIPN